MENDDIQKGCRNCKHCSKLITEEPCMDCDPRTDSPKNHWEDEDIFTRKEELSKEESEWLIDFITKENNDNDIQKGGTEE